MLLLSLQEPTIQYGLWTRLRWHDVDAIGEQEEGKQVAKQNHLYISVSFLTR